MGAGLKLGQLGITLTADGAITNAPEAASLAEPARKQRSPAARKASQVDGFGSDLWDEAAEKAPVHAVVTRFVRFGVHGRAVPCRDESGEGPRLLLLAKQTSGEGLK